MKRSHRPRRGKEAELAELRRVEIVNKALQVIVVLLLSATAYWTQQFVSDTKSMAVSTAKEFSNLTTKMQEFSEQITQNLIELDRRVLILEHDARPR